MANELDFLKNLFSNLPQQEEQDNYVELPQDELDVNPVLTAEQPEMKRPEQLDNPYTAPKQENMGALEPEVMQALMTTPRPDDMRQMPSPAAIPQISMQDLDRARSERDDLMRKATLLRGFQQIATSGSKNVRPDYSASESLEAQAKLKTKDIMDTAEAQKMNYSLRMLGLQQQDADQLRDPKNPLVPAFSQMLQQQVERQGGKFTPVEGMTLLDLQRMADVLKTMGVQGLSEYQRELLARRDKTEERLEASQKEREKQQENAQNKRLLDSSKILKTENPVYKKAMEQKYGLDNVLTIMDQVEKGNQASIPALGSQLARAMGEVGVLTDADVVRYLGNVSWGRKLLDWYSRGMEGELPKETLRDLKDNIGAMRTRVNQVVNRNMGEAYDRFTAVYPNEDPQRLARILGIKQYQPSEQKIRIKAPNGKIVLVPEDKVDEALKAGGELVK